MISTAKNSETEKMPVSDQVHPDSATIPAADKSSHEDFDEQLLDETPMDQVMAEVKPEEQEDQASASLVDSHSDDGEET